MRKKVVIIGDGISGLILSLVLSKKTFDVTLVYQTPESEENSALICPQLVIDFLEQIAPGISAGLKAAGAHESTHQDLLEEKFPQKKFHTRENLSFHFLSRRLLINELSFMARKLGVKFVRDTVLELVIDGSSIKSAKGAADSYTGDFFFDCTGTTRARREWLPELNETISHEGPREEIFQRFFQGTKPAPLLIRSLPAARGGIYPIEDKQFVINLSCPEGTEAGQIEELTKHFLSLIGGEKTLAEATPLNEWRKLTKQSFRSNYYETGEHQIENFFPVGESVLSSLPVYGRGISLVVLQISPILEQLPSDSTADDFRNAIIDGYREAEEKWKEVSGKRASFLQNHVKKWSQDLIEKNPEAYECFLSFYQLRLSPLELFFRLIKAQFLRAE